MTHTTGPILAETGAAVALSEEPQPSVESTAEVRAVSNRARSLDPPRLSFAGRIVASIVVLVTGGVMLVAAWLPPAPDGVGTHVRLNLPPCNWITSAHIPCPTCGMTTAFAHAADGEFFEGFYVQPFGFILALATVMVFWVALYAAVTGSTVHRCFTGMWRPGVVWALAAAGFMAWVFKIYTYTQAGGTP